MAKKKVNHSGVIPLCSAFMHEVNRRSGGDFFAHHRSWDITKYTETAYPRIVRDFLNSGYLNNNFPAQKDKDLIGYVTLVSSDLTVASVKKALREEGLDSLVHIIGHSARVFSAPLKIGKLNNPERRLAIVQAIASPIKEPQ